jgi:hypothetical protein
MGALQLSRTIIELCDELVSPSGDDGLPRRVLGRMVIVSASWAAFGVATRPDAHVHGVYRSLGSSERVMSEQSFESLGIEPSVAKRVVEAAPATAIRRLQAHQVDWRGYRLLRGEESVGELEEGIGTAMEAVVE